MARRVFTLLLMVAGLQAAYFYPQLPATIATHFDGNGVPNGWSSKAAFFALNAVLLGVMTLIFVILPAKLDRIPERWLNLPNKNYWWAPPRRAATLAFIRSRMLGLGAMNVALAVFIQQLVIEANLRPAPQLSTAIYWALLAYTGFMAVWLVQFLMRFRRNRKA